MSNIKLPVEFNLNPLQIQTLVLLCKLSSGWSYVDILVRYEGQDYKFEADFLRDLCKAFEKTKIN